jgi:DNA repair protein RadC
VLQLAQELLEHFGGIAGLLHASADDLKRIKGLGAAPSAPSWWRCWSWRAARWPSSCANARRWTRPRPSSTTCSCTWRRAHEVFAVLFLDSQHRLIALEELFRGTLTQTSVYPREVVLRALHHQASGGAGAQPPQRQHRAQPRRRGADAKPEGRAGAGGRARARPRHRRAGQALSMAEKGLV